MSSTASAPAAGVEDVAAGAPAGFESAREGPFAAAVAALVFAATLPRLLLHEMWRDEVWLWLVAIESRTLGELVDALSRSGQGYLFPLLVRFAALFTSSPVALQLLNLAIVTAGAYVFARWAPFSRPVRVLFLLGYLPFYEYAVLSRHYALGALLTWIACAAARSRRSSGPAIVLGLALGLLCQTTVYGLILAGAIAAGWLAGRLGEGAERPAIPLREAIAGAVLATAGAFAGLVQVVPAAGTVFAPAWRFGWEPKIFERLLQAFWRPIFPLPEPRLHFWNSNLLEDWPLAMTVAGPLALAGALALLWPRRAARVAFATGAAGLALFGYVKFIGFLRHTGHLWLLLFAALWIGGGLASFRTGLRWRRAALLVLLAVHVAAAVVASAIDLARPFSGGPEAARLLREHGLDRLPLIGFRDPPSATVALALGQPLYSPSRKLFTTHPHWGPGQREVSVPVFRCAARDLAARSGGEAALVANRDLPAWPEAELVARTSPGIERSEEYRLYRLRLDRIPAGDDAGCGASPSGAGAPPQPRAP